MPTVSLRLLGSFEARIDGQPITKFRSDKARALLAYLAMHADQPIRRETLAALLWGDISEDRARANLRNTLSNLRKLLPANVLTVTRQACQFNRQAVTVDVASFLNDGLLESYRGEFLAGLSLPEAVAFAEWRIVQQEQLHLHAMRLFDEAQVVASDNRDFERVSQLAQRQIGLETWHEPAHRQLMAALAALGRREAALAQYDSCAQLLLDELGIEPSAETKALRQQLLQDNASTPGHNLPAQTTPFFGRIPELTDLETLLTSTKRRWLTLVGMGGIGKTRLAQQVGYAVAEQFSAGVCYVPLAEITAGTEQRTAVAQATALALGVRLQGSDSAETQLHRFLQDKQQLIIFDNFEHLLDAGGLVNDLIAKLPTLHVLCTSREALGYRAEMVKPLSGFTLTDDEALDDDSPALALFAERAEAAVGQFTLNATTRPSVANICRWVDGSPLGIELAAAWLRSATLAEIWQTLQQSYRSLRAQLRDIPARQRSMQTVFHYSWSLLDERQQDLLSKLAVFRGPFSAEAAQTITEHDRGLLDALCGKSLLKRETDGRFYLHELLRQFSAEKLAPASTIDVKHSDYYLAMLTARQAALSGATPQLPRAEIAAAIPNVRKAWPLALQTASTADLCSALRAYSSYFQLGGYAVEAEHLFDSAASGLLERENALAAAYALIEQTRFLVRLSRYAEAQAAAQRALAQTDDGWVQGMGRVLQGEAQWRVGDFAKAEGLLHDALAIGRRCEQPIVEGWSLHHLGISADMQTNHDEAQHYLQQAVTMWETIKFSRAAIVSYSSLGIVATNSQNHHKAHEAIQQALTINQEIGDSYQQAHSLITLSTVLLNLDQVALASQRLEEAQQIAAKLASPDMLAIIAFNFAGIATRNDDKPSARTYLAKAGDYSRRTNNKVIAERIAQAQADL